MKKDWTVKKLGEVVKVERGSSPRPIEKYLTTESNGVNWVKIGDTKNVDKVILSTKEKITPEGAEKSRFVQKGDFILSNSMSLGKPYIMGIDGYIHDGWFVLRLPETIDSDYFFYHLSSDFVQNQFSGLAAGAIVKNISSDLVKKANLIIPPLEEQKRIVAVLDKKFAQIETLKTAAEKKLQNTKQLFQAELINTLNSNNTWIRKPLGEVVVVERGSSPRPIEQYFTTSETGVNWIKIGDTKNVNKIIYSTKEKITPEGAKKSRLVKKGDFILSNSMSLGKPYIMGIDGYIHDGWFVLRLPEDIDTNYFFYLLSSDYVQTQFTGLAAGAIVKNISSDLVKKAMLILPPLEEQKRIVAHLDSLSEKVHQLEEIYTKQLADCDELKQSLLQKAFEGEL